MIFILILGILLIPKVLSMTALYWFLAAILGYEFLNIFSTLIFGSSKRYMNLDMSIAQGPKKQ